MRACVFRRPRKSLTSPDAVKTSAATQRPGEELRNWQVPYCGKPNHFAAMCRSTAPTQSAAVRQRKRPQRLHEINDADYDMSDQESTIGCLSASVNTVHSGGQPYTTLHVGCDSVPMKFKVDTGAQINVIPITAFDMLAESHMKQLKPTQVRLTGYSGNVVPTSGTCRIECKLREKPHTLEFFLSLAHTQRQS